MRVLIIQGRDACDIIHTLPCLDFLQTAAPGIEIDWVLEESFREILEGNQAVSSLFLLRSRAWRAHPLAAATRRELARLKDDLRQRGYDMVFDLQGDLTGGLVSWLTGCTHRVGFSRDMVPSRLNLLFSTRQTPLRRIDHHAADRYLRLVSVPFGKDFRQMQLTTGLSTGAGDDANAAALLATLSDGLVFLFHCGASTPTRLWGQKSWMELGRRVLEDFPESTILLSWQNQQEREQAAEISRGIGAGSRVLDGYGLKGLTALLKKVDLVVAADCLALQLAAAVGTPTVSFYRASDAKMVGPRGERHVVVQSPIHCSTCGRGECDKDRQCRDSIKVEAVFLGVERLLSHPVGP